MKLFLYSLFIFQFTSLVKGLGDDYLNELKVHFSVENWSEILENTREISYSWNFGQNLDIPHKWNFTLIPDKDWVRFRLNVSAEKEVAEYFYSFRIRGERFFTGYLSSDGLVDTGLEGNVIRGNETEHVCNGTLRLTLHLQLDLPHFPIYYGVPVLSNEEKFLNFDQILEYPEDGLFENLEMTKYEWGYQTMLSLRVNHSSKYCEMRYMAGRPQTMAQGQLIITYLDGFEMIKDVTPRIFGIHEDAISVDCDLEDGKVPQSVRVLWTIFGTNARFSTLLEVNEKSTEEIESKNFDQIYRIYRSEMLNMRKLKFRIRNWENARELELEQNLSFDWATPDGDNYRWTFHIYPKSGSATFNYTALKLDGQNSPDGFYYRLYIDAYDCNGSSKRIYSEYKSRRSEEKGFSHEGTLISRSYDMNLYSCNDTIRFEAYITVQMPSDPLRTPLTIGNEVRTIDYKETLDVVNNTIIHSFILGHKEWGLYSRGGWTLSLNPKTPLCEIRPMSFSTLNRPFATGKLIFYHEDSSTSEREIGLTESLVEVQNCFEKAIKSIDISWTAYGPNALYGDYQIEDSEIKNNYEEFNPEMAQSIKIRQALLDWSQYVNDGRIESQSFTLGSYFGINYNWTWALLPSAQNLDFTLEATSIGHPLDFFYFPQIKITKCNTIVQEIHGNKWFGTRGERRFKIHDNLVNGDKIDNMICNDTLRASLELQVFPATSNIFQKNILGNIVPFVDFDKSWNFSIVDYVNEEFITGEVEWSQYNRQFWKVNAYAGGSNYCRITFESRETYGDGWFDIHYQNGRIIRKEIGLRTFYSSNNYPSYEATILGCFDEEETEGNITQVDLHWRTYGYNAIFSDAYY